MSWLGWMPAGGGAGTEGQGLLGRGIRASAECKSCLAFVAKHFVDKVSGCSSLFLRLFRLFWDVLSPKNRHLPCYSRGGPELWGHPHGRRSRPARSCYAHQRAARACASAVNRRFSNLALPVGEVRVPDFWPDLASASIFEPSERAKHSGIGQTPR